MSNQTTYISYEQPVSEIMRTLLRIEHLQTAINYFVRITHPLEARISLNYLVELLQLLDRSDLRSKFIQEVLRYRTNLQRLRETPTIDMNKLNQAMQILDDFTRRLHQGSGKFGETLRKHPLINSILQNYDIPAGTCSFDTPGYHWWIHQDNSIQRQQLQLWLDELDFVFQLSNKMLHLTRETGVTIRRIAHQGFYQMQLDPLAPTQLIRLYLDKQTAAFPRISTGRHGVSVRFFHTDLSQHAEKIDQDIAFDLVCCVF